MRLVLMVLVLCSTMTYAQKDKLKDKDTVKQKIKCNMTLKYTYIPDEVESFGDFLTKGMIYGRLRLNYFNFNAGETGEDHYAFGVGGSLIYKSAMYKGFSFTSGLYTSQSPWHEDKSMLPNYRSGKDTFNRYNLATKGNYGLTALAQNYIEYKMGKSHLKIGRFMMEGMLVKSNDTKMIPNTFEGAYAEIRSLPKTRIQLAYISKQKLRDHDTFHHVLAYGDKTENYGQWRENDDGGMHRGLTLSKLKAEGINDKLIVIEAKNKSIKRTTLRAGFTTVPNLVSSLILEGTHTIKLPFMKIRPSVRYMQQFDHGAGKIGGANLRNNVEGYQNPDSLASALIASRIDFVKGPASLRLGYSKVSDKGDIIAPWRGFPTAGYSRAMGQTNWYANTETVMIRADYDFSKAKLIDGFRIMMRYAQENFDDKKPGVSADVNVLTMDFVKRFKEHPNLMTKIRTAFINERHPVLNLDGSYKKDPTYNEVRIEMNYLF